MTNDFRSYDVNNVNNICKNENHWSLLITRYSLLITRNTNTPTFGLAGYFENGCKARQ